MGFATTINNMVFKRTSTFILAIAGCTFFFERTFDLGTEKLFERLNEGKLWKHIKHKYEQ